MNVVDATSTSKRETNIALSQRNLIKIDDIHKELNKLRVLYRSNRQKNNKLML